jgi:hypothetical protein
MSLNHKPRPLTIRQGDVVRRDGSATAVASGLDYSNFKPSQNPPKLTPFTHPKEFKMSPSVIASRSQSPEQDFLAFGEDFVKSPEHLTASTQSIDFDGLLDSPLLLHEDLAAGCGGMLWPAGMRMAKYLLKMKKDEIRNAESMCVP